jgi:beta-lactamase family protein
MVIAFELEEAVRDARARTGVPGVAAGLSVGGDVTLAADGVLELGRAEPVRPDTPFRIASVSKAFTAALLAASGLLDERTRALLSHTAGLRPESADPLPELCRGLWSYSNAGYWQAADALAEPFEAALLERVLEPLRLDSTGIDEPPRPARGHVQEGETGHRPVPFDAYPVERAPSGGLWSTVGDLLRFGAGQSGAVFEPRADALGARYALGWWVRELDGATVYDHEGSVAGYQSLLMLVPERELALAVLTNSWRGSGLIRRVVEGLGLVPRPQPGCNQVAAVGGRYALDGIEAVVEATSDGILVEEREVDPVTGAPIARRYPMTPLEENVYGFARGTLMGHRVDFPRPGVARIGWVALPRVDS